MLHFHLGNYGLSSGNCASLRRFCTHFHIYPHWSWSILDGWTVDKTSNDHFHAQLNIVASTFTCGLTVQHVCSHSLCHWQLMIREDTRSPVRSMRKVESESCLMVHYSQMCTRLTASHVSTCGVSWPVAGATGPSLLHAARSRCLQSEVRNGQ